MGLQLDDRRRLSTKIGEASGNWYNFVWFWLGRKVQRWDLKMVLLSYWWFCTDIPISGLETTLKAKKTKLAHLKGLVASALSPFPRLVFFGTILKEESYHIIATLDDREVQGSHAVVCSYPARICKRTTHGPYCPGPTKFCLGKYPKMSPEKPDMILCPNRNLVDLGFKVLEVQCWFDTGSTSQGLLSLSAPAWSNKCTTSVWPWKAAKCRGVDPFSWAWWNLQVLPREDRISVTFHRNRCIFPRWIPGKPSHDAMVVSQRLNRNYCWRNPILGWENTPFVGTPHPSPHHRWMRMVGCLLSPAAVFS